MLFSLDINFKIFAKMGPSKHKPQPQTLNLPPLNSPPLITKPSSPPNTTFGLQPTFIIRTIGHGLGTFTALSLRLHAPSLQQLV